MATYGRGPVPLFYTDEGTGPVALLMHGWGCDSHDWSWQIPDLLEAGFRVVALDHRGHGRSAVPSDGDFRPSSMAADAAGLLRDLDSGPALVVGHSMGTIVGSLLAVQWSDLVSGLILIDPVYSMPDKGLAPILSELREGDPHRVAAAAFESFYPPGTPSFLPTWHRRRLLGTQAAVLRETFLGLYDAPDGPGRLEHARAWLPRRTTPRLAVYANERSSTFERDLPAGDLDEVCVVDGGHFLHQTRSEQLRPLMLDWLRRADLYPTGAAR